MLTRLWANLAVNVKSEASPLELEFFTTSGLHARDLFNATVYYS